MSRALSIGLFLIDLMLTAARPVLSPVDLTYNFDSSTVYWPTTPANTTLVLESFFDGITASGMYYRAKWYKTAEHGGTHMDAPSHFSKTGKDVSQFTADDLIGTAIVINVTEKAVLELDYAVTVEDIHKWERDCGKRVPRGAFVLMNSNWGVRWPNTTQVFQSSTPSEVTTIHFPSFGAEAVEYLIRTYKIKGVGVDTPSTDIGQSRTGKVHQALAKEQLVGLENVANVDKLQPCGNKIVIAPVKLVGASGIPVRIFAWPDDASP